MDKGDVRCPEIACAGAAFVNPGGDLVEDVAAELPVFEIVRAAHSELTTIRRLAGGEDVPRAAGFDNGWIVRSGDIARKCKRAGGCASAGSEAMASSSTLRMVCVHRFAELMQKLLGSTHKR